MYGRLLTRTDGSGTVQEENRYLPDGRLALSREADGQEIRYAYGAHGREEETSTARNRKAGRKAIPMTLRAMSPVPGMPTAA